MRFMILCCKGMQKRVHLKENTCTHLGSIPNTCIRNGKINKRHPRLTGMSLYLENKIVLYLDLYLNTAGEFKLHQGINSLSCRAVDVDQTLVV